MPEEVVEALVEGGKASAGPPLGPALGPMGVNIGQVISEINKKTADFKGMQVPVKVIIDTDTKQFEIEVGTPPTSELIKKEIGLEKGSADQKEKVGEISLDQVIKISRMKEDSILGKTLKSRVKEVIGTANAMGVWVEGKRGKEISLEIDEGKYDDKLKE